MANELRLGCAKVDITPETSLPLAGFGHRTGNFEAVDRKLYARLFLFEQDDSKGGAVRSLIVSGDLIWWTPERMEPLRELLAERWMLKRDMVIFSATHTHSGPQTSKNFVPSLGVADDRYLAFLERMVGEGIERALGNLEPVTVSQGKGSCSFGIHRRKIVDGRMQMAPNENGPTDAELRVIRYNRKADDSVKAVWMHYTCHPTTTDLNRVSSEFPGVATEQLETELGGQATVAYLQGCCGDIRPALVRDGNFYRGGDREVRKFGEALAEETLRVLRSGEFTESRIGTLSGAEQVVPLPYGRVPDAKELENLSGEPGITGEWSRFLAGNPGRLQPHADLELTLLRITEDLSLLAMNAEMVVEYGLYTKEISNDSVLPLAYCNGMVGYVPTAQQIGEGGYEALDSFYYFAYPSAFSPEIEGRIKEGIGSLAGKVSGNGQ